MLKNKKVLLAISGGIAAYKSAELVRRLIEQGAKVQVVMTQGAQAFITPLTLQALSGRPVRDSLLDSTAEAAMGHIELARWADLILIAPATADVIAKLVAGIADDLLTTLCLASTAPLAIAPAMNQQMWQARATRDNIHTLKARGVAIWGPACGEQACGEIGPGRMLEPVQLCDQVCQQLTLKSDFAGKVVLITAGPTRENIDPVRYLSNYSSGKMGYALAEMARRRGAKVILVSGPVRLAAPAGVTVLSVESALQMRDAVMAHVKEADIMIGAAAVADFRPEHCEGQKIKKGAATSMQLHLVKNPDIIAEASTHPQRPFTVGFAAETHNQEEYANKKLIEKELDMIAMNDVSRKDIGFNSDENSLRVLWREGEAVIEKASKLIVADQLLNEIKDHYEAKSKN
ncbi:bifunctional phosphopantothenoylcysteine decarboxylase/phosphopantothenate--cysteine ligase CoaBC [Piscirickettsia litoralis]|uniref:Coenzyme A biosynthesis bifunctional protein CoaBC n=1 Tax=Piscirickettsia litoralis TaxID=1891921 RepID=A0ABX3A6P3_9GAMM|nr:bifunctional phosphopantothenoylcysteine decarboxylase/phosphopantothenate--cysteine ligase CoaBC [Piscirickettsia litoralis]ODN43160.1 phosphopantothenoylcysteine decarboxylase [Piscirickettsia litoralis]